MDKSIAIGVAVFTLLIIAVDLTLQALCDLMGWRSQFTTLVTYFIAAPIALWPAHKAGRITHLSILLASLAVAIFTLGAITYKFDRIAQPVGRVPWNTFFSQTFWRHTTTWVATAVMAPQLWLFALNRYAANNSFNPMRLRRTD